MLALLWFTGHTLELPPSNFMFLFVYLDLKGITLRLDFLKFLFLLLLIMFTEGDGRSLAFLRGGLAIKAGLVKRRFELAKLRAFGHG